MTVEVVALSGGVDVVVLEARLDASPASGVDVVVGPGGPMGPPGPAGGLTLAKTAAQALGGHRAVKLVATGEVDYPNLAASADGELILGVTLGAVSAGAPAVVQVTGEMVEASWSWSAGPVFCGVNGVLTQSPIPGAAWLRQVGVATAADRLLVDLRAPFILA